MKARLLIVPIIATVLLLSATGHAQVTDSMRLQPPVTTLPADTILLTPYDPSDVMGTSQSGDWQFLEGWRTPEGWTPPEGSIPPQDGMDLPENAYIVPIVVAGIGGLATVIVGLERNSFCWYDGRYSEGSPHPTTGQRCACTSYLGKLIRFCGWKNPES